MTAVTRTDLKTSLKRLVSRFYGLIAVVLFMAGIVLRVISINRPGAIWPIVGELGTFLAAVVAIPFIYERFLKKEDRQTFLDDLAEVLDQKLKRAQTDKVVRVYEEGRLPLAAKVALFEAAKRDIVEVGTAVRSFVGYFEQRPYSEFKKPVVEVLKRGVNFHVLVLDPDSEIAGIYAKDRNEPDLPLKIKQSIERLLKLRDEFRQARLPGEFDIRLFSHFPSCYALMVDPGESEGRMHVSHYLHDLKRADTPVFEIHESDSPVLFEKYRRFLQELVDTSRKL